jgi:hypothetical protein
VGSTTDSAISSTVDSAVSRLGFTMLCSGIGFLRAVWARLLGCSVLRCSSLSYMLGSNMLLCSGLGFF